MTCYGLFSDVRQQLQWQFAAKFLIYELYKWSFKSANLAPKSIVQHHCPQLLARKNSNSSLFRNIGFFTYCKLCKLMLLIQLGAYPGPRYQYSQVSELTQVSRYFTTNYNLSYNPSGPLIFPFVHLKKILQHTGMFLSSSFLQHCLTFYFSSSPVTFLTGT